MLTDQNPELRITPPKILYDGYTNINGKPFGVYIAREGLAGYPAPIFRFRLNGTVNSTAFRRVIRDTNLSITSGSRGLAGEPPYYAEDHNGYSGVVTEEQQRTWAELIENPKIFSGSTAPPNGLVEFGYSIPADNFIAQPIQVRD